MAWKHRILETKEHTVICQHCGEQPFVIKRGLRRCRNAILEQKFGSKPEVKERAVAKSLQRLAELKVRERPHRKHVTDKCDRCGFVPEHVCQLDVHHKDHNHSNNHPDNLQTLCANCHRLVHHIARIPQSA